MVRAAADLLPQWNNAIATALASQEPRSLW
jgi:hypothetical protein